MHEIEMLQEKIADLRVMVETTTQFLRNFDKVFSENQTAANIAHINELEHKFTKIEEDYTYLSDLISKYEESETTKKFKENALRIINFAIDQSNTIQQIFNEIDSYKKNIANEIAKLKKREEDLINLLQNSSDPLSLIETREIELADIQRNIDSLEVDLERFDRFYNGIDVHSLREMQQTLDANLTPLKIHLENSNEDHLDIENIKDYFNKTIIIDLINIQIVKIHTLTHTTDALYKRAFNILTKNMAIRLTSKRLDELYGFINSKTNALNAKKVLKAMVNPNNNLEQYPFEFALHRDVMMLQEFLKLHIQYKKGRVFVDAEEYKNKLATIKQTFVEQPSQIDDPLNFKLVHEKVCESLNPIYLNVLCPALVEERVQTILPETKQILLKIVGRHAFFDTFSMETGEAETPPEELSLETFERPAKRRRRK